MENLTLTIENAVQLTENRFLKIHFDSDGGRILGDDDGRISSIVYKNGSRYALGDKPNTHDTYAENSEEAMLYYFAGEYMGKDTDEYFTERQFTAIRNWIDKNAIVLPVYAYVHGSATISTKNIATCPWDSGCSGFVYTTKQKIRDVRACKRVTKDIIEQETEFLRGHVKVFDDILQGNVYGFEVVDENDEHVDSCWGFIGDLDGDNGLNMADHIDIDGLSSEEIHEKIKEATVIY